MRTTPAPRIAALTYPTAYPATRSAPAGYAVTTARTESDHSPAEGYRLTTGKRAPNEGKYWVQFRNGWCDLHGPYPAKGPRWIHDGSEWDIVAVRKDGEAKKTGTGRQADGSYE